jgi:hypothetical protein
MLSSGPSFQETFTFMHPVQILLKNSHSSQINLQADNNIVDKFIYNITGFFSKAIPKQNLFVQDLQADRQYPHS